MSPHNRATLAQTLTIRHDITVTFSVQPPRDWPSGYPFTATGTAHWNSPSMEVTLFDADRSTPSWESLAYNEDAYWIVLHELGHLMSRRQRPWRTGYFHARSHENTLRREYDAWHWAVTHSVIPLTSHSRAMLTACLYEYERAYPTSSQDAQVTRERRRLDKVLDNCSFL